MRRRNGHARNLTAEQVVSLYTAAVTAPAADAATVRAALAERGYDVVDAIRARLWLRRGKPRGYRWDR